MSLQKLATMAHTVYVEINPHREAYEKPSEYIKHNDDYDETPRELLNKMDEKDTMVKIQCYPKTPVGFFTVCALDIDSAVEMALETMAND